MTERSSPHADIQCSVNRRQALAATAGAGVLSCLPLGKLPFTSQSAPGGLMSSAHAAPASPSAPALPHWLTLLGTSEQGSRDYAPEIEGTLPADLSGVLYRNGPGLFERDGYHKQHLLDGDGLVQRLSIRNGRAHYRNAFVQTPRFVAEQAAGRYKHASWTTRRPGGMLSNLMGGGIESQAGVTVYPVHGKIAARDESGHTFFVDPRTLATTGQQKVSSLSGGYKAHAKLDPATNEWILAGQGFGPSMSLKVTIYRPTLEKVREFSFDAPRQVYIHDFLATKSHIVFVLHPCHFSPFGFLAGMRSFSDSLTFNAEDGTVLAVVPKDGGAPRFFDVPGSFMWHALNAFEDKGEIIADIVAYDEPDHFIGDAPLFKTLMTGETGNAAFPGTIRRYVASLETGKAREEILDSGNHEFPMTDPRAQLERHRIGYFACGGVGGINSGIKRMDMQTGATQLFDFGAEHVQVGEPVFAPRDERSGAMDDGWLIAQCLDAKTERTFFAVFDAQTVDAGPLAKVWLTHHMPISFHGSWVGSA
ncbi:carotenoid oxygenase family protein [Pyruvatibacter mobilis]|uniref:carotenoid oxygenase family protein n=1 Tax=Pyruvatibacter mobilis TaxID=1712261 RepID=UPI003BAFD9D7